MRRQRRHGHLRRLLRGRPPPRVRDREVPRGVRHPVRARSPTTGASSSSTPRSSGSRSRASASARSPAPTTSPGTSGRPTASTPSPTMVHTEAAKLGEAYWLVDPRRHVGRPAHITAEHPSQCIVACAPATAASASPRSRSGSTKTATSTPTSTCPTAIAKFRSTDKARAGSRVQWQRRADDPGGSHDLGEVPMIPLRNAQSMTRRRAQRPDRRAADPGRAEQAALRHARRLGVPGLPAARAARRRDPARPDHRPARDAAQLQARSPGSGRSRTRTPRSPSSAPRTSTTTSTLASTSCAR
jgi:hypothetical protein